MTTKMQPRLAEPRALTSGIAGRSLSRYTAEIVRRLLQGWTLSLADYVRLEESLVPAPPQPLAGMKQTWCLLQHTSRIGQPRQQNGAPPP